MKLILVIFMFGIAVGCSETQNLKFLSWNKSSQPPPQSLGAISAKSSKEISVQLGKETISRGPQNWLGAEIEDSFVSEIKNEKGELTHFSAQYIDTDLSPLNNEITNALKDKYVQLLTLKNRFHDLKNAVKIWQPRLTISSSLFSRPSLHWTIDYIKSNNLGAFQLKTTLTGSIISNKPTGSGFTDSQAIIYPNGPKISKLTEVPINSLLDVGNRLLRSTSFSIYNDVKDQPITNPNEFAFDPSDSRFNQIQSYYYIENFISYFKNTHNFNLPFPLDINVNVLDQEGNPTTAMFYYKGNLRLGAGDDITWSHIPQDQSIVLHEATHAIIDALAGLPYNGEGGSMNEGIADFITGSYLNYSKIGEVAYLKGAYTRNIDNNFTFNDKKNKKYQDSLIVSGTLWEIRAAVGKHLSEKLVLTSLARMNYATHFSQLSTCILEGARLVMNEKEIRMVEEILKKRLWP